MSEKNVPSGEEAAKEVLAKKRAQMRAEADASEAEPGKETSDWNIWQKMLYIQQKLKVGKNRGKGHGGTVGYEYRNAQDILEGVKPLLAYTGTTVHVSVTPEMVGVGAPIESRVVGKDKAGNDIYARMFGPRFVARAKASLFDFKGNRIDAESFAEVDCWRKGQTEPEKLCGSADSYASKYALAHLFGLDDGKDADSEGDKQEEQPW